MLHSLRNRIILAFGLIVMLAILMTTLVALWSAENELEEFVSHISSKQSIGIAGIVEVVYNRQGSLDALAEVVRSQRRISPQAGASLPDYDAGAWQTIINRYGSGEGRTVSAIMRAEMEQSGDTLTFRGALRRWYQAYAFVHGTSHAELPSFEQSAAYLLDANYAIQYRGEERREEEGGEGEGHGREREGEHGEEEHHSAIAFYDWTSREPAGYLLTEGREEFRDEHSAFTQGTFSNGLYGGLITAVFALGISIWLANRINAPVQALTRAATRLAESGDTEHIEVHSEDELGQMSAAFNQMADALHTQQQIRQQLIADISHELNTPLSIMRLETQGMIDGMQTPGEAASNIMREIDLLRGLISDLELIAEVDHQTIQLVKEPVAVADFLTEVMERWHSKASLQDVQFHLELESLPPTVAFDRNRMRQVLGNLLRNALQHTEPGGEITVTASATPNGLAIAVRDTGHGIEAEHLPRLFERFYRFEKADQNRSSGRGLGLAIVKQLVELHGGQVNVTSEPGVGSTFVITLPR